ncbi:MAG: FAD-dependent oxidoreductase [bacterium]|nr:FAD-dependent oxidoreductase [bacterium]
MSRPTVVVLGGGLAGMAAAYSLGRAGCGVTLVERGPELGGLAGTFRQEGSFYPLAYHHILHRDRVLLWFLDAIGALPQVRWRKIRMLFQLDGRMYDLAHPVDFLRFPMSLPDKARFARLMLRSFRKSDWSDWHERSAEELVDRWGGPGVRDAIFERLSRLKFELPCSEVSGAWLGARLYFREGSAPLGYISGTNWTKVLCEGTSRLIEDAGVDVRVGASVTAISGAGGRIDHIELEGGERLSGDIVVSTLPTETYLRLAGRDATPGLEPIRYTAIVSAICATRQKIEPEFYWMNLAGLDCSACGIFRLESLNPTIGREGDACLNFVTHVPGRDRAFFRQTDEQLLSGYFADFRRVFGFELEPFWSRVLRLPMYSPVFRRGYRNPDVRSATWSNVYFAGNYRTFPSIASTGTALGSGLEAAHAILADRGVTDELHAAASSYRLRGMPRA